MNSEAEAGRKPQYETPVVVDYGSIADNTFKGNGPLDFSGRRTLTP